MNSSIVVVNCQNATSAPSVATFLMDVLHVPNIKLSSNLRNLSNNFSEMFHQSSRLSKCDDLNFLDHCLLDLSDVHATTLLITNSGDSKTFTDTNIDMVSSRSGAVPSLGTNLCYSFVVGNADACINSAMELGCVLLSEINNNTDKAFHLRTSYGFRLVLIESSITNIQHLASLYWKVISATSNSSELTPVKNDNDNQAVVNQANNGSIVSPNAKSGNHIAEKPRAKVKPSNGRLWNPLTGRKNPFLRPYILTQNQYRLITPNSDEPVEFSNDIFEGKMLLMVRSSLPMEDKYTQRFTVDKNVFELQVQGRFKRVPSSGFMYLGGEITKKMELGLLTKGFASSLLQFCKTFNASIHHSYGDNANIELPHIVGPFWSMVDRVVITPPGETPPSFITGFPESLESRMARRAGSPMVSVKPELSLDNIYSFSFKTKYVDLESWSIINIPFMKEFKLQTFWSDADLRFIAYFIDPEKVEVDAKGFPKLHTQSAIERVFTLELQNASNHPEWKDNPYAAYHAPQGFMDEEMVETSDDVHEIEGTMSTQWRQSVSSNESITEQEQIQIKEEYDSEEDFFDALDGYEYARNSGATRGERRFSRDMFALSASEDAKVNRNERSISLGDLPSTPILTIAHGMRTPNIPTMSAMEALPLRRSSVTIDDVARYVVPAVVEVDELRKTSSHNRRTLYAFKVFPNNNTLQQLLLDGGSRDSLTPNTGTENSSFSVLRTYREWKDCLPVIKASQKRASFDRWGESEQRRWALDDSYRYLLQDSEKNHATRSKLEAFLITSPHTDGFLHNTILSCTQTTQAPHSPMMLCLMAQLQEMKSSNSDLCLPISAFVSSVLTQLESNVCVRKGNFHWAQEHLSLTDTEVVLRRPGKRLGTISKHSIPLTSILDVRSLQPPPSTGATSTPSAADFDTIVNMENVQLPIQLPDLVGIVVTTFPRQYLLLLRGGASARDVWMQALTVAVARALVSFIPQQQQQQQSSASASDVVPLANTSGTQKLSKRFTKSFRRTMSSSTNTASASISQTSEVTNGLHPFVSDANKSDNLNVVRSSNNYGFITMLTAALAPEALRFAIIAATSNQFNSQDLLVSPSPLWHAAPERLVLNARSFRLFNLHPWYFVDPIDYLSFHTAGDRGTSGKKSLSSNVSYATLLQLQDSPVELVALLLELALEIAELSTTSVTSPTFEASSTPASAEGSSVNPLELARLWMLFMDGTSLLQTLSIAHINLSSAEAVCLFVNLFHVMLLHALLVLGLPSSIFKWQSMFRNCAYEAFGDIFTLAELEHNIIKNGKSIFIFVLYIVIVVLMLIRFELVTE